MLFAPRIFGNAGLFGRNQSLFTLTTMRKANKLQVLPTIQVEKQNIYKYKAYRESVAEQKMAYAPSAALAMAAYCKLNKLRFEEYALNMVK